MTYSVVVVGVFVALAAALVVFGPNLVAMPVVECGVSVVLFEVGVAVDRPVEVSLSLYPVVAFAVAVGVVVADVVCVDVSAVGLVVGVVVAVDVGVVVSTKHTSGASVDTPCRSGLKPLGSSSGNFVPSDSAEYTSFASYFFFLPAEAAPPKNLNWVPVRTGLLAI